MTTVLAYTDEQIAQVVHEMNRGLQYVQGDLSPSQPWQVESEEIQQTVIVGVQEAKRGVTPREHHERWCAEKRAQGWRYGEVKDPAAKTHPCLVAYDDLPSGQRLKNELFLAVVAVMASAQ